MIQRIVVKEFENSAGTLQDIRLSYEVFGPPPGEAPIVLVNHALTGNSVVTGTAGWWKELIGEGKCIDTGFFTVLAFNMPGNGYDAEVTGQLHNYRDFTLGDIASIYARALDQLGIASLFAGIGGSIGGALLWELAALRPGLFKKIIPVATDYKASQWLRALCKVQDQILQNSAQPLKDARMHAMTIYRSPQSLDAKFGKSVTGSSSLWDVEFWLEHHGRKLEERFKLASYKLMNHLLTTIDISKGSGDHISVAARIEGEIHIVTVNSDRFFMAEDNWNTYVNLSLVKNNTYIHEIKSIHGHDAFLIENSQMKAILEPVFNTSNLNKQEVRESISS